RKISTRASICTANGPDVETGTNKDGSEGRCSAGTSRSSRASTRGRYATRRAAVVCVAWAIRCRTVFARLEEMFMTSPQLDWRRSEGREKEKLIPAVRQPDLTRRLRQRATSYTSTQGGGNFNDFEDYPDKCPSPYPDGSHRHGLNFILFRPAVCSAMRTRTISPYSRTHRVRNSNGSRRISGRWPIRKWPLGPG